jgi:DNA adenine methylase
MRPKRALLADSNQELIACYRALRDSPGEIVRILDQLAINRETFTLVARSQPTSDEERAARVIYLNRTAFNGLWRVNAQGNFNVPFGCKPETRLPDAQRIQQVSEVLSGADFLAGDFRATLDNATIEDIVYLDPPYTVAHNANGFVRYNEIIFSWQDQVALAEWASGFAARGGRVIVSNAAHPSVIGLYSGLHFRALSLDRPSNMAAKTIHRSRTAEMLFASRAVGLVDNVAFPSRGRKG